MKEKRMTQLKSDFVMVFEKANNYNSKRYTFDTL